MKILKLRLLTFLVILISIVIITAACQQVKPEASEPTRTVEQTSVSEEQSSGDQGLKEFTVDDLAKYNGKNGNPAYIAVEGKVYDVTNVPEWKDGIHNNRFEAGRDLTEDLKLSPHGKSKLDLVSIVGILVQ